MLHHLKIHSDYFGLVKSGVKTFEVRKNDREFRVGDELLLEEYNSVNKTITGNFCHRRVDYILPGGQFGIESGYVVLGINKI